MAGTVDTLNIIVDILAALGWAMVLYKFRDLVRDPTNRPLRALCFGIAAVVASMTAHQVDAPLDQLAGRLDFGRVVSNCLILVAAGHCQAFLLYMTNPEEVARRRIRRRTVAVYTCIAAIIVLYAVTPPRYPIDDPFVRSGASSGMKWPH